MSDKILSAMEGALYDLQQAATHTGFQSSNILNLRAAIEEYKRLTRDAEPVAKLHIRLEDDGLEAKVEVIDGEFLQVEHSPVSVFLHPPLTQVPEWQPIETAPKDGTRILVTADDHIHAAHYDKTYSSPWRITDGFGWSVGTPDCWMPLPAAPKEELK